MPKIKWSWALFAIALTVVLTFATRFYNISWGLPFPFHPDERNMAAALQQLQCASVFDLSNCFNPHFFAYGQFPLYLGLALLTIFKMLTEGLGAVITFEQAIMVLRLISASSSVLVVYFIYRIVEEIAPKNISPHIQHATALLFVFSPALIQFAHFGTTESLLMLLFSGLLYVSIKLLFNKLSLRKFILISSFVGGLGVATKVSSATFLITPLLATVLYLHERKAPLGTRLLILLEFGAFTLLVAALFSPQNIVSIAEFLGSLSYETEVARGMQVFYTRSFFETTPILFQFHSVFSYALGIPVFALFIIGFFLLPSTKLNNFLRLSFLTYFIPVSFLYTKWTRFMAPIFPLAIIICSLFLITFFGSTKIGKIAVWIVVAACILPGIAYMNIYMSPDVRTTASIWIDQNIPNNSHLLSETANVVDIPLPTETVGKQYDVTSFNFYELDENPLRAPSLRNKLKEADYILIPSRRIYKNHTCLSPEQRGKSKVIRSKKCDELMKKYPLLNEYYRKLFSGELGFKQVAKFRSYPQISIGGHLLFTIPDEESEETWTVFDHPIIRIYKKVRQVDF